MRHLDPSRFAAVPAASLDGTVNAAARCARDGSANADIVLAPTSGWPAFR